MTTIDNALKKRFCKDFKLPINIFSEPYFEYFVDLYDPVYDVSTKMKWFQDVLNKVGNTEAFFKMSETVSQGMKKEILNSKAYQEFNSADMNALYPMTDNIKQQNIYIEQNVDKPLISIDLHKANFNCLNLFNLKEELQVDNYDELMKKHTNEEYFLNSKMIRQVIFGDLNPSRQQRLQKHIIHTFCKKLLEAGCELSSASSDEIIVKSEISVEQVREILKDVPEKYRFYRVEPFTINRISDEYDFFVKKTITEDNSEKLEFKNVAGHLFAQVYKKYFDMQVNEYDMMFYHEGFLAQFKEPLFQPTMKNNLKL